MVSSDLGNGIIRVFLLLPLGYPSLVSTAADGRQEVHWTYDDPNNWGAASPECNGARQSPIRLESSTAHFLPIPPIKFGNYDEQLAGNMTLTNNGHSVELQVPVTINGQRPFITGGVMADKYEAVGVHFHWGSNKTKGSEHIIGKRRFDVEMHVVHKNVNYETVAEAAGNKDGLAVLGVMFKIVNDPDRYYPGLNKIFDELSKVRNYGDTVTVKGYLSLGQLLGDLNTKKFFTYKGSLTTPSCAEAVTWSVFPEPLPIARAKIIKFWSILDRNGTVLHNNYRPVQDLNERLVFYRPTTFF